MYYPDGVHGFESRAGRRVVTNRCDTMTTEQSEPIDRRWLYAVALSGVTFAFALANATIDPEIITVGIAFGLGAVFLLTSLIQVPAELGVLNRTICRASGHEWDLEPPWSGKELRYRPQCEACGYQPEEIAITGKHEGDHRV